MRRTVLSLAAALLLGTAGFAAACGGGGGSKSADTGTTGGTPTTATTEPTDTGGTDTIVGKSDAYKTGQAICGNNPLEILAQQYGVKPDPIAIAKGVAAGSGPPSSQAYKDTYRGCLDAIRGAG